MATTYSGAAATRYDGLIRALCAVYVIVAVLYVAVATVVLKMQWDSWQMMENLRADVTLISHRFFAAMVAFAVGVGLLFLVPPLLMALRRGFVWCFAAAVILTMLFPVGTVLGGLTVYALLQVDVQAQFGRRND